MGIKGNEGTDKATKQEISMPEMTTKRLRHADNYVTIRNTRNSEWQRA